MFTFGDVLGIVALLVGVCLTGWATLLAFSLLFPARAEQAAAAIDRSPMAVGVRGLVLTVLTVIVAIVLVQVHKPVFVAITWLLVLSVLSLAALGGSGLAMLMARRIQAHEPHLSAYTALMRGAALVVVPGILPVFGWFLVAPVMLIMGVGAGTRALRLVSVAGQV